MRTLACIMITAFALSTPACAGTTIHGLEEAQWMEVLLADAPLPVRSGEKIEFDALEKLGPGAILFIGMAAQDHGDDTLAAIFYKEAMHRETGRYRERAAALLADHLVKMNDGEGLIELSASEAGNALPEYRRTYLGILGNSLLGFHGQTVKLIEAIRGEYPVESQRDAVQLAILSIQSGFLAGRGRWSDDFALLVGMDSSPAVHEALARAVEVIASSGKESAENAIRVVGTGAFQLAEARALAGSRDYGPAVIAFRRHALDAESPAQIAMRLIPSSGPDTADIVALESVAAEETPEEASRPLSPELLAKLSRNLSRPAASDAARSLLAASYREGAACFSYIVDTMHDWSVYPSRKYFETYWHGRFLREAKKWKEAEAAFSLAMGSASNLAEKDVAAWYVVECALQQSTTNAVSALGKALASSKNPGYYSDLIEPLSRKALVERDGTTLAMLDAAIMGRASAADSARLAYICARAAQTGIITDIDVRKAFGSSFANAGTYAASRFELAWNQRSESWYRMASAFRLGKALVDPLADQPLEVPQTKQESLDATPAQKTDTDSANPQEVSPEGIPGSAAGIERTGNSETTSLDEYALRMASFGRGARVRAELGAEFNSLRWETIRAIATTLSASGRSTQSYRLIATLFWKAAFKPARLDAELYWPRPYRELFIASSESAAIDEFLLYGLARSESAFDAAVVSKSGAVGLTQLMPATAAEMAGRLKLSDWSMTDPEDNLVMGSAYFARVLTGTNGRVLPALFSYNAGPTRFKRWEAEYGDLPPDLMLEALSYAETRQYGRNVATAALAYAALYGEKDLRSYFAWLIGEGPRP